jgi:HK97 family phage major capsid protein
MPVTQAPGALGAALSPEQWADYVLSNISAASVVIASGATVVRTPNRVVHIARVRTSGGAAWYGELDPIGPGDPTGDELRLEPHKCAALTTLSNESVNDSTPSAIDAVGTSMMRAVGGEVDRAYLVGAGPTTDEPTGVMTLTLPEHEGAVDYAGIVTAAGTVRGAGGRPNALFLNPSDLTALQLATDGMDRPLIQADPTQGMAETIAGLRVWATPAITAGEALIAEASQLVIALRQDATVAVSDQAAFGSDGSMVRVICRTDVGVNDEAGLCKIVPTPPPPLAASASKK